MDCCRDKFSLGAIPLQFSIYDEILNPDDTAMGLGLEDGDPVDVVVVRPVSGSSERVPKRRITSQNG